MNCCTVGSPLLARLVRSPQGDQADDQTTPSNRKCCTVTRSDHSSAKASSAEVAREIAIEQAHVDLVYAELAKAQARAGLVEADGLARGRTDRTGDVRDEELTGLFERDALVFNAARRRSTLDTQYEGLVFGRLDLDHALADDAKDRRPRDPLHRPARRPRRRLRAPRRRLARARRRRLLPRHPGRADGRPAPPGAALQGTRRRRRRGRPHGHRGARRPRRRRRRRPARRPDPQPRAPRCATSSPPSSATRTRRSGRRPAAITEITGGPGTGKTVVALHRAAYLLYSDRRRFEAGGILVVGPSSAYTAYIERVLPSLGEESVTLRSLGDVVDGVTASRLDTPEVAAIKGSLRIRRLLARAAADAPPEAPESFRAFVNGKAVRVDAPVLDRIRAQVLRNHQRNLATKAVQSALAEAAWASVRDGDRAEFMDRFEDHLEVDAFLARLVAAGRPPRGAAVARRPRAGPPARRRRAVRRRSATCSPRRCARARDRHLVGRRRRPRRRPRRPARPGPGRTGRGARVLRDRGVRGRLAVRRRRGAGRRRTPAPSAPGRRAPHPPTRASCCSRAASRARASTPTSSSTRPRTSHPCSGGCSAAAAATRRGPSSATPPRPRGPTPSRPAAPARRRSASQERRLFHMDTNYRNAREIFDYAAAVVRAQVPDADIPQAVRETGVDPVDAHGRPRRLGGRGDRGRRGAARRGRGLDRRHHPGEVCRGRWPGWATLSDRVVRHRPDVDQGPGVRRHRHRRPRRDHGRVTRWGAGPLRRAHPGRAPDDGAPPRLARTAGVAGSAVAPRRQPWSHPREGAAAVNGSRRSPGRTRPRPRPPRSGG